MFVKIPTDLISAADVFSWVTANNQPLQNHATGFYQFADSVDKVALAHFARAHNCVMTRTQLGSLQFVRSTAVTPEEKAFISEQFKK